MNVLKNGWVVAILIGLSFVLFGYYCPINWILGFPCPGCNMTTACVHLLKLDIQSALFFHAMCIPTIFCALIVVGLYYKGLYKWVERVLWIWAFCMISYYIYRMIYVFPQYPMEINRHALLSHLW